MRQENFNFLVAFSNFKSILVLFLLNPHFSWNPDLADTDVFIGNKTIKRPEEATVDCYIATDVSTFICLTIGRHSITMLTKFYPPQVDNFGHFTYVKPTT